jgi:hypothetical protein
MEHGTPKFAGFYVPNSTQVPDTLFDELLAELSGAELKVVLYIIRRTFGFKRPSDTISINQLLHGITKKSGEVLDRGTGLTKPTLLHALKRLTERAIIIPARQFDAKGGFMPTEYRLNIAHPPPAEPGSTPSNKILPSPLGKKIVPGEAENFTKGLVKKSTLQDTVLQDTENTVTVNVNGALKTNDQPPEHAPAHGKTDLRELPDLNQPKAQTQLIAEEILGVLGDTHSQAFYYLVAAKIPANVIHTALSEIKHDGAASPARVFTYRMKHYAEKRLAKDSHLPMLTALAELTQSKKLA